MFGITAADIALLNDEDLRALVGLLCEAEARRRGFPTSSVTYGGHQNAADGGLDVRVALPVNATIDGFVPRRATGFQVKKQDMPRSEILAEMCPAGLVRSVIQELTGQSGAYVIVSSTGSTSDMALRNRREAMREAVKGLANADVLTLDFYDRTRLATWVRDHAGLIPWVREKAGKVIPGWRPYAAWAYAPEGLNAEYLLDDKVRIRAQKKQGEGGLRITEGIKDIRERLRKPGSVVRVVGLSGVGKTRLAQSLFDHRIGEHNLDPSLAIYTNMADAPDPQPTCLASDLLAARTRAILIIDNCTPDLHRRLSELCRCPESTLSMLTVEYDIQEDQPEGTDVFELEPSSNELIEKLVRHRFPALSMVDAGTVARFSDGNARIAIALAETVKKNETIEGLNDQELLQRLFQQRQGPNESLMIAAEACSLVYSFQGEDVSDGDQAELVRLGNMVGENAPEMFRMVAELLRRDLIQQRGVWRAVLPHAIANRLAEKALQNIPLETIQSQLVNTAPARLLKSFSRRLSYLHASNEAIAIVRQWLTVKGLLGNVADLSDVGRAMFANVAPVAPDAALSALERGLLRPGGEESAHGGRYFILLLRSLAYEATFFERCIALILKIIEAEDDSDNVKEATDVFTSLFFLYLSGTHATIEQRLATINSLLLSNIARQQSLGLNALRAALETWQFSSSYNFDFGAHSRDHGYWPRSKEEVKHWFRQTLKLSETLAISQGPSSSLVRAALAERFRGLWTHAGMYDELERVCRTISQKQFWPEGWIAVRETQYFHSKGFTPEVSAKLASLERLLGPTDLLEKVRAMVLSKKGNALDFNFEDGSTDDIQTQLERMEANARILGKAVATDEDVFSELLPELVSSEGRLWSFGEGLAEGAEDPSATWNRLVAQVAAAAQSQRKIQILCGFLSGLHTRLPQLSNLFLDDAVQQSILSPWYPMLQIAVGIDKEGFDRLMHSLGLGNAPISIYRNLAAGRASEPISGHDFEKLVLGIAANPSGFEVASDIVYMRLHSEKYGKQTEILNSGRELMRQLKFAKNDGSQDYHLGEIVKHCLIGEKGGAVVQELCAKLKDAVSKYETYCFNHAELVNGLFIAQPRTALDCLLAGDAQEVQVGVRIIDDARRHRKNPLDAVPESELLGWCDREVQTRYPTVAALVTISSQSEENGSGQWTNIALRLLEKAPDRIKVLEQFVGQFSPMSWSGSFAVALEANAKLLDELEQYPDPAVVKFVANEKIRFGKAIEDERRAETDRERNLCFE